MPNSCQPLWIAPSFKRWTAGRNNLQVCTVPSLRQSCHNFEEPPLTHLSSTCLIILILFISVHICSYLFISVHASTASCLDGAMHMHPRATRRWLPTLRWLWLSRRSARKGAHLPCIWSMMIHAAPLGRSRMLLFHSFETKIASNYHVWLWTWRLRIHVRHPAIWKTKLATPQHVRVAFKTFQKRGHEVCLGKD